MKLATALLLSFSLALAACARAPEGAVDAPAADADVPAATAETPEVLPPPEMADGTATDEAAPDADAGATDEPVTGDDAPPANAIAVGEPNPAAPGTVDTSCTTDADCAIKDVGSCCGYRPACVNADSPTFPKEVQAQCAKDGRMGICGFPAITGCTCTAGKCEGTGAGPAEIVR
jgi:hypothetical protein